VTKDRLHYFRGILSHLEGDGFDVHHTRVSFAHGLETRANDLKNQINGILAATGSDKVHIIAHSMGGLDSRFMIARLGMADKVVSLTTIGTPHLGTSFADYKLERGGQEIVELVSKAIDLRGFENLTRASCKKFNESVRNAEATNDVHYQTYSSSEDRKQIFSLLQLSWDIINKEEGANDGLVPVTSQKWQAEITADGGTVKKIAQKQFPLPADHLNQVGWWDLNELHGFGKLNPIGSRMRYETEIKKVYSGIARDLREKFPI
jgi:triacylglycerol lipase